MDWIEICGDIVNSNQITHIVPCILGRNCGASFDEKNNKFVVIGLSCGQRYRLAHCDSSLPKIMQKLNLNFHFNGVENS